MADGIPDPPLTVGAAISCAATFKAAFIASYTNLQGCARTERISKVRAWPLEIHWIMSPAWRAGAGGGAIASAGQFAGSTTFDECLGNLFSGEIILAMKLVGIFLIATALMSACGACVAYFLQVKTQSRWTLFLAGAAATSIGTTALPGIKNLLKRVDLAPISTAYAANEKECNDNSDITIFGGLKDFFGLTDAGYRVVIGSVKKPTDADAIINKVKSQDPSLKVSVGERAPCNDFYPVIVGPATNSLTEAKKLQTKVQKLDIGADTFISNRSK